MTNNFLTVDGDPILMDLLYKTRNGLIFCILDIIEEGDSTLGYIGTDVKINGMESVGRDKRPADVKRYCWNQHGKSKDGDRNKDLMKIYIGDENLQQEDLKLNVLDHGFVRLVSYMQPAIPTKGWTGDLEVVRNARVSYAAAWRTGENEGADKKLINYLWKNRHSTPFESMTFTFEIKAPIFVFRQWHRHRTWSYNELSARYKELPEEFYVPEPTMIGVQSASSKQARNIEDMGEFELEERMAECETLRSHNERSFVLYRQLIEKGWPRELARSILPVSTYSHMFATVNLLNLLKFLSLRTHSHAQYEIRVFAEAMMKLITPVVPVCMEAWEATREA